MTGGILADASLWSRMFSASDYGELLALVQKSLIVGAIIGVMCGLISVFVMMRDLPFAVHGISELSFSGAAAALLFGFNVIAGSLVGSLIAALLIGALGVRARDRNSIIGVLMAFGLGLGVLFLALYPGRAATKFGVLTGQVVAVSDRQVWVLGAVAVGMLLVLAVIWRPLVFASLDPEVAAARGVPVRLLSPVFMVLLGACIAGAIQVVGPLLVLSVVVTPAAAAMWVTSSRSLTTVLSVVFATVSVVGGIMLAVAGSLPISPYITTISFVFYVVCRVVSAIRSGRSRRGRPADLGPTRAFAVPSRATPDTGTAQSGSAPSGTSNGTAIDVSNTKNGASAHGRG